MNQRKNVKTITMLMDKNQELYNYIKKIQTIFQNSEKKISLSCVVKITVESTSLRCSGKLLKVWAPV